MYKSNYLNELGKFENIFKPIDKKLETRSISKNDFLDYLFSRNKRSYLSNYKIADIGNRYITFVSK